MCLLILKLVYKYHEENKIHGKFIRTLPHYRHFNKEMPELNRDYQVGKFITIYPKNDDEAKKIVESLHTAFEAEGLDDSCFLEISDDFKVYPGIYVRMSEFHGGLDDNIARGKLCIPTQVFKAHCNIMEIETENYQHPFDKLYAHGKDMPKDVCKINDAVKKIEEEKEIH